MAATGQDVTMTRGDAKTLRFEATEGGSPKDLTGMTIRWWCDTPSGPIKKDNLPDGEGGITIIEPEEGEEEWFFEVDLEPSDTSGAPPNVHRGYDHEAEATDSAGRPLTIATGKLKLETDLIRNESS